MSETVQSDHKYRRDVGTFGVAFLVLNGLIGSGIFALPELLHQAVGTFAPWMMLACALLISSVAFCFANDIGYDILREFWPEISLKLKLPFTR